MNKQDIEKLLSNCLAITLTGLKVEESHYAYHNTYHISDSGDRAIVDAKIMLEEREEETEYGDYSFDTYKIMVLIKSPKGRNEKWVELSL